ncbi:MAG TPA: class I SAM-dependent methyltransferase [Vicinamibacterales bacterium]|nr:class I SAM-dependent methyltransferase [Vicinamibacterales bacterium]
MTDRVSQTAEVMALFRALETLESPRNRLFADPYATRFLRPAGRLLLLLARLQPIRRRILRIIDRKWPGARTSAVARTRLVDDLLRHALKNGARQVLILGAGFDTRAYRIPEIATARVFEVDHPLTQAAKIRVISRAGAQRATVTHVPVDFTRQTLDAALRGSDFDVDARSFVLWEGVTNYLTEAAVDATLRAIFASVAPGSELFLTYVHHGLLDGSRRFDGGAEILERVREVGEPWTCGFEPREMPAYLVARSFALLEDLSADEYRSRYFGGAAGSMKGYSFYRAVLARRSGPERSNLTARRGTLT